MMLVPLYIHPKVDPSAWELAAAAGPDVTVVVNVHNGPGVRYEAAYAGVTARLAAAGVPMLGYVDLAYGARPGSDIGADVAGWARYPVGGIFFDQVPSGPDLLGAVARLASAVHGSVVLNPGTRPHPGYAAIADIVCTFEGPLSIYLAGGAGADWPTAAHLVYGVPVSRLAEAEQALRVRVAHGLVTDLDAPLPYHGLPPRLRGSAGRATPAYPMAPR